MSSLVANARLSCKGGWQCQLGDHSAHSETAHIAEILLECLHASLEKVDLRVGVPDLLLVV